MKPSELVTKLYEVLIDGLAEEIWLDIKQHCIDSSSPGLQKINPTISLGIIGSNGISIREYLHILEKGSFSAMFEDYALIIVECTFKSGKLIKHRYTYIPCPIENKVMKDWPNDISLADWLSELLTSQGHEIFRSVGIYRFDYAPEQSNNHHPSSHFTFASNNCRVPIKAPLSISDFLTFIFDNFYPQHIKFWNTHAPFLTCSGIVDCITPKQLSRLHLNRV